MSNLPIVIQLLDINLSQGQIAFEVYNLDQTHRTIQGNLSDLNRYVQRTQEVRQLGFHSAELLAEHERRVAALAQCDSAIAEQRTALSTVEVMVKQEVKAFQAKNPTPAYDKRVSATMSSKSKQGGMIATLVVAGFGVLLTFTGEGAFIKTLGIGCFVGSSFCAYGLHAAEVDDSSYAQRQRQLKQEAEQLQGQQQTMERKAQETVETAKREIQRLKNQRDQLQQQVEESEGLVAVSALLCELNQKLGDGILYGDEAQFQALNLLNMKQQTTDEAFAKGLAGAALVGLMVVGAFAGIGP